ncbi:MAG: hypothetical protein ACJAV8_001710 [Polaribacter sp.]|jgi:hypothetical protein
MPKLKHLEHSTEVLEISLSFYLGYPIFLPDHRNPITFTTVPKFFPCNHLIKVFLFFRIARPKRLYL